MLTGRAGAMYRALSGSLLGSVGTRDMVNAGGEAVNGCHSSPLTKGNDHYLPIAC